MMHDAGRPREIWSITAKGKKLTIRLGDDVTSLRGDQYNLDPFTLLEFSTAFSIFVGSRVRLMRVGCKFTIFYSWGNLVSNEPSKAMNE